MTIIFSNSRRKRQITFIFQILIIFLITIAFTKQFSLFRLIETDLTHIEDTESTLLATFHIDKSNRTIKATGRRDSDIVVGHNSTGKNILTKLDNITYLQDLVNFTKTTSLSSKKSLKVRRRRTKCKNYVYIHVGKNGGTTITSFFLSYGKKFKPHKCCSHDVKVWNAPTNSCFVTLVRDPIERWVSGYLSRYRMGCPTSCKRIRSEEWIWEQFPSPNHLAEAIYSENKTIAKLAMKAITEVRHLRDGFISYLTNQIIYLDRISYVGLTCDLDNELLPLSIIIAKSYPKVAEAEVINKVQSYRRNKIASMPKHQNPVKELVYLSPLAKSNLKKFLKKDYLLLQTLADKNLIPSADIISECKKRGKYSKQVTKEDYEQYFSSGRADSFKIEVYNMLRKHTYEQALVRKRNILKEMEDLEGSPRGRFFSKRFSKKELAKKRSATLIQEGLKSSLNENK